MTQILPQGEAIRRAAAYVSQTRQDYPERSIYDIIDEAGMRFNLTPLECESLTRFFAHT